MTQKKRKNNPMPKWGWFVVGAVGVGILGWAGYAYAKRKQLNAASAGGEDRRKAAVQEAIDKLGKDESPVELADYAYALLYSEECPPKLDPSNPKHGACIKKWLDLRDMALDMVGQQKKRAKKAKKKAEGATEEEAASATVEGAAADLKKILDGLSASQKSVAKGALGASIYNDLAAAAQANDDAAAIATARRAKAKARSLEKNNPIKAMMTVATLKSQLGSQWDAIMQWIHEYA